MLALLRSYDSETISATPDEIIAALNTPELQRAALEKIAAVPPPTPKGQSKHSSKRFENEADSSIVVEESIEQQTDVTDTSSIPCSDEEVSPYD
jgi:hypothetical protein